MSYETKYEIDNTFSGSTFYANVELDFPRKKEDEHVEDVAPGTSKKGTAKRSTKTTTLKIKASTGPEGKAKGNTSATVKVPAKDSKHIERLIITYTPVGEKKGALRGLVYYAEVKKPERFPETP